MRLPHRFLLCLALVAAGLPLDASAQVPNPQFLHRLANFSGEQPYGEVAMFSDARNNELAVAEGDAIRIYNSQGMEDFEFFVDLRAGVLMDVAVDATGDIWALTYKSPEPDVPSGLRLRRYDFRGRLQGEIVPSGPPQQLGEYVPNRLLFRDGRLLFVSRTTLLVVECAQDGTYLRHWDLEAAVKTADVVDEKDRRREEGDEIQGFALDREGRFLFTIMTRFRAFRFDPETREGISWGKAGSTPGKFGLVAGIAADDAGFIYVSDIARNAVLIFDPSLRFFREFGNQGQRDGRLYRPARLALGRGRLYVAQRAQRGVSVFSLASGE